MTRSRVLVVDDEPGMLHATKRVLGEHYDVASARTPMEAIELLSSFKPELGILDIRMPEMDGFELMGRLKAMRPDLDLIVMTGSVTEADAKLIRAIREKAFYFIQKPFDRAVLLTLVGRCFELRRLTEANRRHVARLEGELEEARAFQLSLLPAEESRVEGVGISARYLPCSELGGDFFDYAPAGKGRATVLVADVSGHGAAAAMLTGIVKAAFHSAQADMYEPQSVITRIAAGIRTLADNMMVTAVCARISSEARALEYVGAGHPPGILWSLPPSRAGIVGGPGAGSATRAPRLLEPTGPLISPALPKSRWEQRRVSLEDRDRLLLYTDGIVEAQNEHEEFGLPRLLASMADPEPFGLDEILRTLHEFLAGRPSVDDITLLQASLPELAR